MQNNMLHFSKTKFSLLLLSLPLFFFFAAEARAQVSMSSLESGLKFNPAECSSIGGKCEINFFSRTDASCSDETATPVGKCIGTSNTADAQVCCKVVLPAVGGDASEAIKDDTQGFATFYRQWRDGEFQGKTADNGTSIAPSLPVEKRETRDAAANKIQAEAVAEKNNASGSFNYTLLEKIPGVSGQNLNLASYLSAIYKLAIWIVGLCALFMFLIGAFMYMLSAANTSKMGSAKEIMQDALIGLVLALTSYLLLYVINPDLVNLRLPSVSMPTGVPTTPAPAAPTPGECSNCIAIPSTVPNKGCGNGNTCQLNADLLSKIEKISGVSGWRITESFPPTVAHDSACHQNGTCADLNNSGGPTDPATIKRYYDAFRVAGLDVLYESKGCDPYIAAGITNCKTYSTMTNASSFHVK